MVISRVEISESFIGIPYDGSQNSVRQRLKSEEKETKTRSPNHAILGV